MSIFEYPWQVVDGERVKVQETEGIITIARDLRSQEEKEAKILVRELAQKGEIIFVQQ